MMGPININDKDLRGKMLLLVKNYFETQALSGSLISSFNFRPKSEINQFVEIALLILSLEISETIEEVLETFGEIEYQKYEKEGLVSNFILIEQKYETSIKSMQVV